MASSTSQDRAPAQATQDAVLEDEISGTTIPTEGSNKRNAFAMLMGPKPKVAKKEKNDKQPASGTLNFAGRNGLGAYTHDPASFSPSRVIWHNDKFVAIHDLYPKSSIHTLLLPRSERNLLHPFDAFEDLEFLEEVKQEVKKLRLLVAKELQRLYSKYSQAEKRREAALNGEIEVDELPAGRNWEKDVITGVHAHPSMNHLHVHVLSVDRFSGCVRHRIHYNSFSTPFLIDIDDFPLARDDPRRHPTREGYLVSDLKCWRCGRNFGRRFADLKRHLAEEFETWRDE